MTADYPFGRELEEHARVAVETNGGTVVGSVMNSHHADDFTPYLEAARDSGADVVGLANGHGALLKAMAAMEKLGLTGSMKLLGLLTFSDDIRQIGVDKAQGLYLADSWFWTRDNVSRAWAERFRRRQNRTPNSLHAADYSATTQFLKAVGEIGSADPEAVIRHLRSATLNDVYVRGGRIREDGTMLHDIYLLRVKSLSDARYEDGFYDLVATIPGDEAFPLEVR